MIFIGNKLTHKNLFSTLMHFDITVSCSPNSETKNKKLRQIQTNLPQFYEPLFS